MICYVDLEHPKLGSSIPTEGPEATQRKADILTFKARFARRSGVLCLLLHTVPAGFVHLATSEECLIRALRHASRPHGVHPKRYNERHPTGRRILANVLRLAEFPAPRSEAAVVARA